MTTVPFGITNGNYIFGDFCALEFGGQFDFNLKSCKLEFEFDVITIFGLKLDLRRGMARLCVVCVVPKAFIEHTFAGSNSGLETSVHLANGSRGVAHVSEAHKLGGIIPKDDGIERAVLASAFVPPDSQLGAALGLGAESNVENAKKGKRPFFNWINADDKIATARGGGGGLALVETCHGRRRIKNKDNDRCILGPFRKRFSI